MRTLPLLLVISTTLFHLACGDTVSTRPCKYQDSNGNTVYNCNNVAVGKGSKVVQPNGETVYGSDDSNNESGTDNDLRGVTAISEAVFAKPCSAHQIVVDMGRRHGSVAIFPGRSYGGGAGLKYSGTLCEPGEPAVFGPNCRRKPIEIIGDSGSVKIDFPTGIITTRGMEVAATAVCNKEPYDVVCQKGKCTRIGIGAEDEPTGDTIIYENAVFSSSCRANLIEVTIDGKHFTSMHSDGHFDPIMDPGTGGAEMDIVPSDCFINDEQTSEGSSLNDRCNPMWLNFFDEKGFVKVYLPSGIISTSGPRLTAKAECTGLPFVVECKAGNCVWTRTGSETPEERGKESTPQPTTESEEETPVETDEESTPQPTTESGEESTAETDEAGKSGSPGSIGPEISPTRPTTVINGDDDRSDSDSHPTTVKDSINGNSKQIESTTQMAEKTSTLLIVAYVVGGILILAIFATFLVCLLKKRSSNADEADMEEGDVKTEVISEAPSEQ